MAKVFLTPIDLSHLELKNAVIHKVNGISNVTGMVDGQICFDTSTHIAYVYCNGAWVPWEANLVKGVKGNNETNYRTGSVNLTPANIGAAPTNHAATNNTYGLGTDTYFGHLKVTDSIASTVSASNATAASPKAVYDYVGSAIAASDAMIYKGTIGSSGATISTLPTTYKTGWTYRATSAGTYGYGTTKTIKLEVGDLLIALVDRSGSGNADADWTVAQTNITGISTSTATFAYGGTTTNIPNVTSVGTLPTLGTAIAADDITSWSAGTLPTLGTSIPADDITSWSAGTLPTLGTSIAADDITSWSAGTLPAATYSSGVLTFTAGTVPALSYTARSIPNVTGVGTLPALSYTAKNIPNVTGVGTLPSISYTARTIPNVTGVGTLPSLGTAIAAYTGLSTKSAVTSVSFTND